MTAKTEITKTGEPAANKPDSTKKPRQGNRNAWRNGLRSMRLSKGCGRIAANLLDFRRGLEDALGAKTDASVLTIAEGALIHSAMRHERAAQLAERWLRMKENEGSITLAEQVQLLTIITRSTDARDKAIARLGLKPRAEQADANPYAIFGTVQPSTKKEGEHIPTANNATEGHTEPQNGKQQ